MIAKKVFNDMTHFGLFGVLFVLFVNVKADNALDNLLSEIKAVLNAEDGQTRQHHYQYRPQNNAIGLDVYQALRSIAKNDELECVSRLLCEAAAGGQPGYSGKQIKFDKLALTNLMSYLKLDIGSSSPLLVFGKAALLGVSNRGDPYSCIINYPKCPKDQSRLLYYLNNHRGGFFQYFDKQYHKPGNYYYQQYRPVYQKYGKHFKHGKIQFENSGGLFEKYKKKATSGIYATRYAHSTMTFPDEAYKKNKPMVFPKNDDSLDPRILSTSVRVPEEEFSFSSSSRFPKALKDSNFFPQSDTFKKFPAAVATDRLPSRFFFPKNGDPHVNYPIRYTPNNFFPVS